MVGILRGVRTPQLNRGSHGFQILLREKESRIRIDDDGGLDPWIVDDRLSGNLSVFEFLAGPQARRLAVGQTSAKVRVSANDNETGVAAEGEAVEPDTPGIDACRVWPRLKHVVNRTFDIGGPLNKDGKTVRIARVALGVARVIDR